MTSEEERRRWDYAVELAGKLFDESDEGPLGAGVTPSSGRDVHMAARAIYRSDIPTGDLPAAVKKGHPLASLAEGPQEDAGAAQDAPAAAGGGVEPPAAEDGSPGSAIDGGSTAVPRS